MHLSNTSITSWLVYLFWCNYSRFLLFHCVIRYTLSIQIHFESRHSSTLILLELNNTSVGLPCPGTTVQINETFSVLEIKQRVVVYISWLATEKTVNRKKDVLIEIQTANLMCHTDLDLDLSLGRQVLVSLVCFLLSNSLISQMFEANRTVEKSDWVDDLIKRTNYVIRSGGALVVEVDDVHVNERRGGGRGEGKSVLQCYKEEEVSMFTKTFQQLVFFWKKNTPTHPHAYTQNSHLQRNKRNK